MESTWFDNNASFAPYLPPIMVKGRYLFKTRLYTSKNETILFYENHLDIIPRKEFRVMGKIW